MSKNTLTPFEQALLDASLEEFADIPAEDEIDAAFSPAFTRKADQLIRHSKRRSWHYVNTALKRAVLVAAVLALLVTTVFAVPAVREAVIRFFVHDEGTHFEFSFDPEQAANAPEYIETAYCPTYTPDGYTEVVKGVTIASVVIFWESFDNRYICFSQSPMPEDYLNDTIGGINSEEVSTKYIYLNGYEIFRIESAETVTYVWTNHEYYFDLMCPNTLPEEEIQKIFSSVQIDADAVIEGAES